MRLLPVVAVAMLAGCHRTSATPPPFASIDVRMAMADMTSGELQASVTAVLERACSKVPHVARVRGTTEDGLVRVTVQLEPGADVSAAFAAVQKSVDDSAPLLPTAAVRPTVTFGPGPVVARYLFSSATLPLVNVTTLVTSDVVAPVSQVAGTSRLDACGGRVAEVRVEIDLVALAAVGLGVSDVVSAVAAWPAPDAGGAAAMAPLVLGYSNGVPIRMTDIAAVRDDGAPRACQAYDEHGPVEEAIVFGRLGTPKETVQKSVDDAMQASRRNLPPGIDVRAFTPTREITVELNSSYDAKVFERLREVVAGAAAGSRFVVEIGDPDGAADASPSTARILVAPTDDALAPRIESALTQLPFVATVGVPNASIEIVSADRAALEGAATALFQRLSERGVKVVGHLGGGHDVTTQLKVDVDKAHALGIRPGEIEVARSMMRARGVRLPAGSGGVRTHLVLRGALEPGTLGRFSLHTTTGSMVPLSAIASMSMEPAPPTLLDEGGLPMIGARVHTNDLPSLQHVFEPPAGVVVRVFPD